MKIVVEPTTLSDKRWFPILDVVLLLIEDWRHSLSGECVERVLSSNWLQERSRADRDLIRLHSIKASHDRLADKSSIIIDSNCTRRELDQIGDFGIRVHPLDAISILSRPFVIVVENELFDGSFLLWMARALGFDRFVKAYRDGRFVFRHAGGKDWLVRSAEVLARGVWPRAGNSLPQAVALCACALLDNDSRFPGHDPNLQILAGLRPYVALVHQLQRRSIESYLSHATLLRFDSSPAFKRKVDALFRLDLNQRKYYNMKTGFRFGSEISPTKDHYLNAHLDAVKEGEKQLFANVLESDWPELAEGFGRKLAMIYVAQEHRPTAADGRAIDAEAQSELRSFLEAAYQRI